MSAASTRLNIALWSPGGSPSVTITRHAPGEFDPLVPAPLAASAFLCTEPLTPAAMTLQLVLVYRDLLAALYPPRR